MASGASILFTNPAVVLMATVRNDVFLLELRERHELLLQTFGNLGEPSPIWRPTILTKIAYSSKIKVNERWNWRNLQLSSAVFAEAEEARVNSIEAIGFFWCKGGRSWFIWRFEWSARLHVTKHKKRKKIYYLCLEQEFGKVQPNPFNPFKFGTFTC